MIPIVFPSLEVEWLSHLKKIMSREGNYYRYHIPERALQLITEFVEGQYHPRYQDNYIQRYFYVLDYLARESSYRRTEIPIDIRTLGAILGISNSITMQLLQNLQGLGLIRKLTTGFGRREGNGRASTFELCDRNEDYFLGIKVELGASNIASKLISKREDNSDKFRSGIDGALYSQYINSISISTDFLYSNSISSNMYNLLSDIPMVDGNFYDTVRFKKQYSNLLRVHDNDIFLKRPDLQSRVYCNFSMLHKEFRQYLHVGGQPLIGVDVGCSQPLLSGLYMKQYCIENNLPHPKGLSDFIHLCEIRKLYEEFMTPEELVDESLRGEFKKNFFGSVFFTKPTKAVNDIKTKFIEKFPEIYNLLVEMKGGYRRTGDIRYKQFPIELQRFEASIIYEEINKPMLLDGFECFNIYDSLVSHKEETIEEGIRRMKQAFSKRGVNPTLVVEDFTKY